MRTQAIPGSPPTNLSPEAQISPDVDGEEFHLFPLSAPSCRSLADGQWDVLRQQEAGGRKTKVPVPPRVGDRPRHGWLLLGMHVAHGHGWHTGTHTHCKCTLHFVNQADFYITCQEGKHFIFGICRFHLELTNWLCDFAYVLLFRCLSPEMVTTE